MNFAGRPAISEATAFWRRPVLAASVLLIFAQMADSAHAAEVWPTTRFKVLVGNPYVGNMANVGNDLLLYEQENFFGIEDHSRQEIERALQEAAEWYKKKGFPPPALKPLISTDDGLAYQVYVCDRNILESNWDDFLDFVGISNNSLTQSDYSTCGYHANTESTDVGGYFPKCGSDPTRTQFFQINHDLALDDNGNLNEQGYVTVAHEMFHAIHANTPAGRADTNCKTPKWIGEGLADAVGYDIAEELWTGRYPAEPGDGYVMKRFGYRPYVEPLYTSDNMDPYPGNGIPVNFGYHTSSFWRYIADTYTRGWKVLVTEKEGGAPGLLDIPITGSPGWQSEADWLDKGLRGKFNLGLQEMYAMFVANLSYHVAPFGRYNGQPAEKNIEHWAERLFGPCEVVNLQGRQIQNVTLNLKPLSSACVRVESVGTTGIVQISFIAGSSDQSLLEDVSIGKGGTTLVTRVSPLAQTVYGPTQNIAAWPTFPQDGSKSALYIVSNVSRKPSNTKSRTITLSVVMPGNTNSARTTVPLPPKSAPPPQQPSYKKHAKSLNKQKAATTKMVQQQMNLDKKSLNPNVNTSNTMSRVPDGPNCAEPFKYTPCGPMLTIDLGIMPGTYIIPGQTNTTGGQAGQILGGLQAVAQTSMFDASERVQELSAVIDSIDGSEVSIAMPLVDYGYSGTFDRAAITVHMAGERSCSAIGPPDANQMSPLTGKVTIEEYSPAVLIGSFVAPLAEFAEGQNGEGVYQSCGTVTGKFTSVAPFLSDERTVVITDSNEQMAEDIVNSLGVPADKVYKMKQEGTLVPQATGGSGSPSGSGGGGGMLEGDCSCECEDREAADELCEFFCEAEFAACDD